MSPIEMWVLSGICVACVVAMAWLDEKYIKPIAEGKKPDKL